MSALSYSQNLFPKQIQYQGRDAVVISVAQMDTISTKLLRYKLTKSHVNTFSLILDSLRTVNTRKTLENKLLLSDKETLSGIITLKDLQIENNSKRHETELELWKAKARGRFTNFLLGTSVGALIVAILTLI